MPALRPALLAALLIAAAAAPVPAAVPAQQPAETAPEGFSTEIRETTYAVAGTTARALRRAMRETGPKGYWAYTRWRVRWSSDCEVRLTISYTFPELADRAAVPLPLRQNWDAMLVALKAHEQRHGDHGRQAAAEILAAGCKGAKAIIRRWSREDGRLDARTRHGRTEGVLLRD